MKTSHSIGPILGFALLFLLTFAGEDALAGIGNPYGQGDPVERAKEAVQANPESSEARFNLATALQSVGRRDEAISALVEAIRIRPDYKAAYLILAGIYHA